MTNARRDVTNARLDRTRTEFLEKLGQTNARRDQTNARLDQTNARLGSLDGSVLQIVTHVGTLVDRERHDDVADLRRRVEALQHRLDG